MAANYVQSVFLVYAEFYPPVSYYRGKEKALRCWCRLCGTWSNPWYCTSRGKVCVPSSYYQWLLTHGLPSPDRQLSLFD